MEQVKSKQKRSHNWLLWILLLISIGTQVYGAYYFNSIAQPKMAENMLFLKYKLENANNQIIQLQQNVDALNQKLTKLNDPRFNHYMLSELINLANQALVLYHDIPGTVLLLNQALDLVNQSPDNPGLLQLKMALVQDIERLSQANTIDPVALASKLDLVFSQIDKLNFIDNRIKPEVTPTNKDDNKWYAFIANIKNKLLDVVQISKSDDPQLLRPEQADIIMQSISLDLLNAKNALFQQNNKLWEYSLKMAQTQINTYFVKDPVSISLNKTLDDLQASNIGNQNFNIDSSISALNKLNK